MKLSQMPIMQKFKFNKKNILIIAAVALIIAVILCIEDDLIFVDDSFIDEISIH